MLNQKLFGMFHSHFVLLAVVLTILTSVVFGMFYLRHQNIVGVTLLHFAVGACAFSIGIL